MRPTPSRFFVCFLLLTLFIACKQKTIKSTVDISVDNRVDSLINTGKKEQYNNLDSLLCTSRNLTDIAISTGNKKALVYGEAFLARYYWLTADHKKSMEEALKCLNNVEKMEHKTGLPLRLHYNW